MLFDYLMILSLWMFYSIPNHSLCSEICFVSSAIY